MPIKSKLAKFAGLVLVVVGIIMVAIFTAIADCKYYYPTWLKIMFVISYSLLILGILLVLGGGILGARKNYITQ